jgi:hypothetical protein
MGNRYRYEYVKQQVDGLQYIASYTKLKKVGQVYRGLCPFHGEKTPSFTVYPKGYIDNKTHKQQEHASFYCFGCGEGGDIIEFKRLKEGLEHRIDACEALEKEVGVVVDDEEAQQNFLQEQLNIIKNSQGNILSLTEINLICSSVCRNYLLWVKRNFADKWISEIEVIEKYYKYFDQTLPERTAIEAMSLIDEVNQKLLKRRELLKEGI